MITINVAVIIPETLCVQIQKCLSAYLICAENYFHRPFTMPNVIIHKKGSVAGTAHLTQNTVKLNALLLLAHKHSFIKEVIPHELAHLLVYDLYGKVRPHGKEWQFMMQNIFNLAAKRTHNFELNHRTLPCFSYQCGCKIHHLSAIRHNRVQRREAEYRCLCCKKQLRPKPDRQKTISLSLET